SLPLCLREIGSTIYQYRPTGESADGLAPGLFAALPITGFALIRFQDGSVNERAKEKILAGLEKREGHALPFYEADQYQRADEPPPHHSTRREWTKALVAPMVPDAEQNQ